MPRSTKLERVQRDAEQRILVERLAISADYRDRIRAARSKYISDTALLQLSNDDDFTVRRTALRNSVLPIGRMREVVEAGLSWRTCTVLKNKNLPIELWVLAAQATTRGAVSFVAQEPKAPTEALLVAIENPQAQEWDLVKTVRHRNFPTEKLSQIVDNPRSRTPLLRGVAQHPDATTEILRKIAARDSGSIMYMLQHQNLPIEIARQVATEGLPYLRYHLAASRHLDNEILDRLLATTDEKQLNRLTANMSVPRERIAELIPTAKVPTLRAIIANTTGEIRQRAIARLAERSKAKQSRYIMAGLTTNPELAERLCGDDLYWVRERAASNPIAPEEGKVVAALLRG